MDGSTVASDAISDGASLDVRKLKGFQYQGALTSGPGALHGPQLRVLALRTHHVPSVIVLPTTASGLEKRRFWEKFLGF